MIFITIHIITTSMNYIQGLVIYSDPEMTKQICELPFMLGSTMSEHRVASDPAKSGAPAMSGKTAESIINSATIFLENSQDRQYIDDYKRGLNNLIDILGKMPTNSLIYA